MRSRMRSLMGVWLAMTPLACGPQYEPPAPMTPRVGMSVAASFANSWDAVVRALDENNVHISSMDRSAGLIAAQPMALSVSNPELLADCGRSSNAVLAPTDATWHVQLRGDSSSSQVTASVQFSRAERETVGIPGAAPHGTTRQCESRGVWELQLELRVKALAESKQRGATSEFIFCQRVTLCSLALGLSRREAPIGRANPSLYCQAERARFRLLGRASRGSAILVFRRRSQVNWGPARHDCVAWR
jgi:hypothetical protein